MTLIQVIVLAIILACFGTSLYFTGKMIQLYYFGRYLNTLDIFSWDLDQTFDNFDNSRPWNYNFKAMVVSEV